MIDQDPVLLPSDALDNRQSGGVRSDGNGKLNLVVKMWQAKEGAHGA